jgi:hypothetical protein
MGSPVPDTTRGALRRLPTESLRPGAVHHFVVGEDTRLRVLDHDDAAGELGDPFAAPC